MRISNTENWRGMSVLTSELTVILYMIVSRGGL